jgi:hypothetical protein
VAHSVLVKKVYLHNTCVDENVIMKCIRAMKTNLMHYLSSVYFVSQPPHVSGIFVAQHQEVYCI